jgi:hypothetical protein
MSHASFLSSEIFKALKQEHPVWESDSNVPSDLEVLNSTAAAPASQILLGKTEQVLS